AHPPGPPRRRVRPVRHRGGRGPRPRPAGGAWLRGGAHLLGAPGPGPQDGRRLGRPRGGDRGGGQDGGPPRQAEGHLSPASILAAWAPEQRDGYRAGLARSAVPRDTPDPPLPDAVTGRGRGCRLTTQTA